jgi:hypothetical protein
MVVLKGHISYLMKKKHNQQPYYVVCNSVLTLLFRGLKTLVDFLSADIVYTRYIDHIVQTMLGKNINKNIMQFYWEK